MNSVVPVFMALIVSMSVRAEEPAEPPATELVRLMRVDEVAREGAVAALARATRDGYFTKAQFDCFAKLAPSALTPALAGLASRQFTSVEIDDALAFYRSAAGKKFVVYLFSLLAAEFGPEFTAKAGPAPELTVDEMREVKRFSSEGVGKKLTYDMVLTRSRESQDLVQGVLEKRMNACGAKIPR